MKKTAKVLAFYFGDRRHYPHNRKGVEELFLKQLETHKELDPGCPMDLIIVNHEIGDMQSRKFLNMYDGTPIHSGVVRILHRPRISFDLSFGSYKYAFWKFQDEYDYWFFCEDDVLPLKENMVQGMIDMMEEDDKVGMVSAVTFNHLPVHHYVFDTDGYITRTGQHAPHIHGGVGLTSTKVLKHVNSALPEYFYTPNILEDKGKKPSDKFSYENENNIEIGFSLDITKLGYKLKCYSKGDCVLRLQDGNKL